MEQTDDTRWEQSLEQIARRFDYPPTPPLAATGRQPATPAAGGRALPGGCRLGWGLAVLALVALAMLIAPPTRAAILSFFARVGAIDLSLIHI